MYTWHGWIDVRATASSQDEASDEAAQRAAETRVADLLAGIEHEPSFEIWDARQQNWMFAVWLAGSRNHRQDRVVEVFRAIGQAAPGSFGVLHVHDDEASPDDAWFTALDVHERVPDPIDQWQRWVMTRGTVRVEADRSLSPFVDVLEDRPSWEQ